MAKQVWMEVKQVILYAATASVIVVQFLLQFTDE